MRIQARTPYLPNIKFSAGDPEHRCLQLEVIVQ